MRQLIPLDIYKSNLSRLQSQGLPKSIAMRVWEHKALWLIVTHKDDIMKVLNICFWVILSCSLLMSLLLFRFIWRTSGASTTPQAWTSSRCAPSGTICRSGPTTVTRIR